MAQFLVETLEQATSHDKNHSAVTKLANRILEISQSNVLDVDTGRF